MFKNESEWNKIKIAYKTTCKEQIKHLSKDENISVKTIIANNIHTSAEILEELRKSNNFWINNAIAKHQNTAEETLRELAENTDVWAIKKLLIENPNTPKDVLDNLSKNEIDKFIGERKINFKF